jgi:hypothetical protein
LVCDWLSHTSISTGRVAPPGHDATLELLANLVNDERVGFSKGRKAARLRADITNFKGESMI